VADQTSKTTTIVLAAILATLGRASTIKHDAGAQMLAEKFDPYGELLPDDAGGKGHVGKATSVLLSRVGQLVFWALAIAIVCVRIRYFSAGL
jgi:hypothetical protein